MFNFFGDFTSLNHLIPKTLLLPSFMALFKYPGLNDGVVKIGAGSQTGFNHLAIFDFISQVILVSLKHILT